MEEFISKDFADFVCFYMLHEYINFIIHKFIYIITCNISIIYKAKRIARVDQKTFLKKISLNF